MDKQEYRTKLDEAQKLMREGNKEEAFYILDGMNWRRVHNVNALLAASVLYENEDRLERAKEVLELAHERSPIGRMIIYRLALICIRLQNYSEAKEYYDEFVEIAPHDSLQYIIAYHLAKAQGAEDVTLISILEELKKHDFLEEWAYELAMLYHKTGQINKCITTCDEIILWYGDGPYVEGALELKLLYQPLDEGQQTKYKDFLKRRDGVIEVRPGEEFGGNGEILTAPIEIPEVALNNDRFNTQNLQAEIKRNIEEIMQATATGEVTENLETIKELVEDLPFAKEQKEDTAPLEEATLKKEEARRIDDTLKNHFREYLRVEHDGQMSLTVPDTRGLEPQVAGQMTIDQIVSNWQKTARAAEQALSEADETRLENAKARAIEEANRIIERLEEAKRKLDAGVAPRDILREEYMSDIPAQGEELKKRFSALKKQLGAEERRGEIEEERAAAPSQDTTFLPAGARAPIQKAPEEPKPQPAAEKPGLTEPYATKRFERPDAREKEALKNQSTFKIKKLDALTGREAGVGFEVPIMEAADIPEKVVDPAARAQKLNRDATRIVSDVNEMLQKEIDRATGALPGKEAIDRAMKAGEAPDPKLQQTGKIDIQKMPLEQTQAFAEAVVRILNEQARKQAAGKEPEKKTVGFDTMSRTMLTEVETGGLEEPDGAARRAGAALEEVPIGEEARKEAQAMEAAPYAEAALDEMSTGEAARKEERPPEALAKVPLTEVVTMGEAIEEPKEVEELARAIETAEPWKGEAAGKQAAQNPAEEPEESDEEPEKEPAKEKNKKHKIRKQRDKRREAEAEEAASVAKAKAKAREEAKEPAEEADDGLTEDGVPEIEITEEQFVDAIYDELPQMELTEDERERFTYFTPISGMETMLCQTLTAARAKLLSPKPRATGNIIIQGGDGTGKTTLGMTLIQVLQRETGKPDGKIGKVDGERLNTKDIGSIFDKIRGGALIIERAGEINRETALELSARMEQDKSGILVILEDGRLGIERAMALNPAFSRRFTEKIVIPTLSIDELVNFGNAYAMELGYSIDEMGVLALYDRINLLTRSSRQANLTEVKGIVDEAIDIAEGGGFRGFLGRFGGRHYDADGNLILQEKDFHGR